MVVKCLNCREILSDSGELRRHRLTCKPYLGAVWGSPQQLSSTRPPALVTDGGRP